MTTTFICPRCGAVSHNPHDAEQRYCGRCHVFVDDPTPVSDLSDTRSDTQRRVIYGHRLVGDDGRCRAPVCCDRTMAHDGDCGEGCCDDYRCENCGLRVRVEWPD